MQIVSKLLVKVAVVIVPVVGVLILLISGLKVVNLYSENLQVVPFGYNYQGKPVSGIVYDLYPNWKLAKLLFLFKGKRQGIEIQWYANGQRWIERHFNSGLEVGIHKAWFPDGKVNFLKNFSQEGIPHGEFYSWHPNGRPAEYIRYHHGHEIAAKSWTAGGKPFYNYVWQNGQKVGLQGDTYCEPKK